MIQQSHGKQAKQQQDNNMLHSNVKMTRLGTILAGVTYFVTYTKPGACEPYVTKSFNCKSDAFKHAMLSLDADDSVTVWKHFEGQNWVSYPKSEYCPRRKPQQQDTP